MADPSTPAPVETVVDLDATVSVDRTQDVVTAEIQRRVFDALTAARANGVSYTDATRRAVDDFVRAAETALEAEGVARVEVVSADRDTGRIEFRVRLPPTPDNVVVEVEIPDEPEETYPARRRVPGPPSNQRAFERWCAAGCPRGAARVEIASSAELDLVAATYAGLERGRGETDADLRRRVLEKLGANR
jgi:hypothetical protein